MKAIRFIFNATIHPAISTIVLGTACLVFLLLLSGCTTAHKEATVAQSPDLATTAWGLANGFAEANPFAVPANLAAHIKLADPETSCTEQQQLITMLAQGGGMGGFANGLLFVFPAVGWPLRLVGGSIVGTWNRNRVNEGRPMCPYTDFREAFEGEYEDWLTDYVYRDIKAYIAKRVCWAKQPEDIE
jgi:hypothetical protein